jgi:hypothetical protein
MHEGVMSVMALDCGGAIATTARAYLKVLPHALFAFGVGVGQRHLGCVESHLLVPRRATGDDD